MTFFEDQARAKQRTKLLVGLYLIAIILIVLGIYFVVSLTLIGVHYDVGRGAVSWRDTFFRMPDPVLFFNVFLGTLTIIVAGSLYKFWSLSRGGKAVAEHIGGIRILRETRDLNEMRLLNVVEEMAIASGTPVPEVYLLPDEDSINAFAAGFSRDDAVVGVTSGCLKLLSRDELQGVIAHEFSHLLNGDMRLNLRLMGLLHGILLIALTGYVIMRTFAFAGRGGGGYRYSGRRSRGDGRVTLAAVGIGLSLMVIGYVGVFFSKIIKSAVSRQREYLADSSAVQFTRNPDGIGGALKKIGGYVYGSRIGNPNAEEASHLFFSNGLKSPFTSLLATHPPLIKRVKRIDPRFDGRFPEIKPVEVSAPDESEEAKLSGQPGRGAQTAMSILAINPAAIADSIGAPIAMHLVYARSLIAALPPPVKEQAHDPFGARALIFSLLLDAQPEIRKLQLERLSKHSEQGVLDELGKLLPHVSNLNASHRLPLIDMSIPALKELSEEQYKAFRANLEYLISADQKCSLFEFMLQIVIMRHLDPAFGFRPIAVKEVSDREVARSACVKLLLSLSFLGNEDNDDAAHQAFYAGMEALPFEEKEPVLEREKYSLKTLDESLQVLAGISFGLKENVIKSCVACIGADGSVTVEEAELIRVIGDFLDCPIPPIFAGEMEPTNKAGANDQ